MCKKAVILVLYFFLSTLLLVSNSLAADAEKSPFEDFNDPEGFSTRYFAAMKQDENLIYNYDMEELTTLFKEYKVKAFDQIITNINQYCSEVADGEPYPPRVRSITSEAEAFKEATGNAYFLELVKRYLSYSPSECKKKVEAEAMIEGFQWHIPKNEEEIKRVLEARALAESIEDEFLVGRTYYLEDIYLSNNGRYNDALDSLKAYLEISSRLGDLSSMAVGHSYTGSTLSILGRNEEALGHAIKALEIYKDLHPIEVPAVSVRHAYCTVADLYIKLGRYAEGVDSYYLSLEASRAMWTKHTRLATGSYPVVDPYDISLLISIGDVYGGLGELDKALEFYFEAYEESYRTNVLWLGNEYLPLDGPRDKRIISDCCNGDYNALVKMADVYRAIGDKRQAFELLFNANSRLNWDEKSAIDEGREVARDTYINKIFLYKKLAGIYHDFGDKKGANSNIKGALNVAVALDDHGLIADVLNEAASWYIGDDDAEGALKVINLSLDSARKQKNEELLAQVLFLHARLSGDKDIGDYGGASASLEEVIGLARKLRLVELQWKALTVYGRILWKEGGKPKEALPYFEEASKLVDEVISNMEGLGDEVREKKINESRSLYKLYIELLMELHRQAPKKGYDERAFTVSESAKSKIFLGQMTKAGAMVSLAEDEEFVLLANEERRLSAVVTNLAKNLRDIAEGGANKEVAASIKQELARYEKALRDNRRKMSVGYPSYADLKKPAPLTIDELQKVIISGETLLAYYVTEGKVFAFLVTKNSFKSYALDVDHEKLKKLTEDFRENLTGIEDFADLFDFDLHVSYELYKSVLEPLHADMKGTEILYLAPDDLLYTVPFGALVTEEVDDDAFYSARKAADEGSAPYFGEYATASYFVEAFPITYLPSASVLRSVRVYGKKDYGKWKKPLIAFADPVFSPEENNIGKDFKTRSVSRDTTRKLGVLLRSTGRGALERLPESSEEAVAIMKVTGGHRRDLYLRGRASEKNVYGVSLREARYLLFSTHGLIGGDFEGVAEPSLAMTLVGQEVGQDGFLTMNEVLSLDLNAELVVLSACNTYGDGDKAGSGEGFAGLSRSFMYAGAHSLLITHWSVESEAARDLMVATFERMKGEGAKTGATALMEAKLAMKGSVRKLKEEGVDLSLSHPFFWAPFVIVGEGR